MIVHIVNAFTTDLDGGNPAGVLLLEEEATAERMQAVAAEMGLAETAFFRPEGDGHHLRWFTPTTEVPLCGHATLASAHWLWETGRAPSDQAIVFQSASGPLTARRAGEWIELDFPTDPPEAVETPEGLADAVGAEPVSVHQVRVGLIVEVADEKTVRSLQPDFAAMRALDSLGFLVTARGDGAPFDFVSRFFAPKIGIDEDPVTGAAHCALAPFWAGRLGKEEMTGFQASARGGTVRVRVAGDRVVLGGQAITVGERQVG